MTQKITLTQVEQFCNMFGASLNDLRAILPDPTPPPTPPPSRLLTKTEFLRRVPISIATLNRLIQNGTVKTKKISGRRLIPESEVERLCRVECLRLSRQYFRKTKHAV